MSDVDPSLDFTLGDSAVQTANADPGIYQWGAQPIVTHAYTQRYGLATTLAASNAANAAVKPDTGKQGFAGLPTTPGTLFGLPYWQVGLGGAALVGVVFLALKKKGRR